MKKFGIGLGVVMFAMLFVLSNHANAQGRKALSLFKRTAPIYGAADATGMTTTNYTNRISPRATLRLGAQNHYTPERLYTYSNAGVEAQRTHAWNQSEALGRPWAGDYQTWRWRTPTAVVVPPTSAYHSSYAWGVGQVRSTPIHSQFGIGAGGFSAGGGAQQTPYHPSSTEQFGYYPVRAPW